MFYLELHFELPDHRFDKAPPLQQLIIDLAHHPRFHVSSHWRQQLHPLLTQCFGEVLADEALVSHHLSAQSLEQPLGPFDLVLVARSHPKPQQLATMIDHEVELEPEEEAHRGPAFACHAPKHAVSRGALNPANLERGCINEGDAGAVSKQGVEQPPKLAKCAWHQLEEAVVGDKRGELGAQMFASVVAVEALEVGEGGLVEHVMPPEDQATCCNC